MDDSLFDGVADVVRSLVPDHLGDLRLRPRRWGIKAWFGPAEPTKEHYEIQILGRNYVPAGASLALELGFHAEHPKVDDNDACMNRVVAGASGWKRQLGPEAELGGFIGREDQWRRLSEFWVDPDLGDDDLCWELGVRLTDYILVIEPARVGLSIPPA